MIKTDTISIIVPCYNEETVLPSYYDEMAKIMETMHDVTFELWLVDDGSSDQTLKLMKDLHNKDERCHFLSFSRNFGKEAAILAGLQHATGDFVAIMDADLQDPPALLPQMYQAVTKEGYDSAAARRTTRKGEARIRSFFSKKFYKVVNRISKTDIKEGARDYRLMNRKMVNAVLKLCEYNRFSKGIFSWIGFDTKWIEYDNVERVAGETKWSFFALFKYSLEGILGFSVAPLAWSSVFGLIFCLLSFVMVFVIIIKTLIWGDPVGGWPSLACILFFVSGIQLFSIGIVGQYLAKTYLEAKRRPIYVLKEDSNEEGTDHEKNR